MNIFPSHGKSANERTARRENWKANMRPTVQAETADSAKKAHFEAVGERLVESGAVSVDGNRYFIQAGKKHFTVYRNCNLFECECRVNEKFGICPHETAAEIFAARALENFKQKKIAAARELLSAMFPAKAATEHHFQAGFSDLYYENSGVYEAA
jgi:hypothetical protein